jgi:hypothetical protein
MTLCRAYSKEFFCLGCFQVELTKMRLNEIANDCTTYATSFQSFMANNYFATIGGDMEVANVHSTIVRPYIAKICCNID